MASIEEIKAGVARFGSETGQQAATIRSIADSMDQTTALLRGITTGSSHARVAEALARMEQVKQKLNEAATLAQGAVEATNSYAASF
jgi:methyl-accepting chemotaxis protein